LVGELAATAQDEVAEPTSVVVPVGVAVRVVLAAAEPGVPLVAAAPGEAAESASVDSDLAVSQVVVVVGVAVPVCSFGPVSVPGDRIAVWDGWRAALGEQVAFARDESRRDGFGAVRLGEAVPRFRAEPNSVGSRLDSRQDARRGDFRWAGLESLVEPLEREGAPQALYMRWGAVLGWPKSMADRDSRTQTAGGSGQQTGRAAAERAMQPCAARGPRLVPAALAWR